MIRVAYVATLSQVLVDMDRKCLTFYKNGVRCGEDACMDIPSELYPMCTLINGGASVRISCPGYSPEFLYMINAVSSKRAAKQQSRAALILKENVVGRPLGWQAKQQVRPLGMRLVFRFTAEARAVAQHRAGNG